MIRADAELENADWTKRTWDLPPYRSDEFMAYLKATGRTLKAFKKTPVYRHAVEKGLIVNDEWAE